MFEADGIKYDSEEEWQFSLFCQELVDAGILRRFDRAESIELIPHVTVKNGKKSRVLLRALNYTPDFNLLWAKPSKLWDVPGSTAPFWINNDRRLGPVSTIDVKGRFGGPHNNSAVTFPLVQKVLYHTQGVYVQKIVPRELFPLTFLPRRLELTKTGRRRKWMGSPVSLDEYLTC